MDIRSSALLLGVNVSEATMAGRSASIATTSQRKGDIGGVVMLPGKVQKRALYVLAGDALSITDLQYVEQMASLI